MRGDARVDDRDADAAAREAAEEVRLARARHNWLAPVACVVTAIVLKTASFSASASTFVSPATD